MDDNDAIDNDDECAKKEDVALLETKEGLTATHAARMATRESKRIAAEVRLKATYENANKYQAEFHRLFTVSFPPDEDNNLSRNVHEEVFITSSSPSDSILFPESSDNLHHSTDPSCRQSILSRAFNVAKYLLESETDVGIIRIAGTSVNLYDSVKNIWLQ